MTQRISLKETYDNRDVIAWLVQQKAQIDDILTRIEGIETIPDNVGSDLRPIRRDNGQFVAVSKNLVQADQTAIGTDTKPIKIFNGEAIPVNWDLLSSNAGDQIMNGSLIEKRNVELSTITSSTQIRGWFANALLNDADYQIGGIQYRRYGNRSRLQMLISRFNDNPVGNTTLLLESFDSGRVVLSVDNNVNGVTTNHSILDSTP